MARDADESRVMQTDPRPGHLDRTELRLAELSSGFFPDEPRIGGR